MHSRKNDRDLDDLLNEIDSFPSKSSSARQSSEGKQDLDNFLGDLCAELDDSLKPKDSSHHLLAAPTSRVITSASHRCYPLYLGTSNHSTGLSSFSTSKCCDRLRCTECDFAVMFFDNSMWDESTTYLFLRNNMPDVKKLSAKLKPKQGWRAYGCQCKFYTASDIVDVSSLQSFHWVCGKH